jgi:hypothetical protein
MPDWKPHPKDYLGDAEKQLEAAGCKLSTEDWSEMEENPGTALFPRVVDYQDLYFHPATRAEQVLSTLYVYQAWAEEILSDFFFIFLAGPPGSGKTNQLESLTLLTQGAMETDLSRASLGRYYPRVDNDEGEEKTPRRKHIAKRVRSLAIDEAGSRVNPNEVAERNRLLRASYKKTPGHIYTRYNVESGTNESFDTVGSKVLAIIGGVDPGLASRGFVVTAAKVNGTKWYQLVLNEKRRSVDNFHKPLVEEFKRWNRWVLRWWTAPRIAALQASANHTAAVASVVSELGANRESELLCTAVTVAMLAGIDLSVELKEMAGSLGSAGAEDEGIEEEVLDALLAVVSRQAVIGKSEVVTIKQNDVLKFLNSTRSQLQPPQKTLSSYAFAEAYRKFVPAACIRPRNGKNFWVLPISHLATLKAMLEGVGGVVNLPNLPNLPEKPVQQNLKVDQVDQVDQGVGGDGAQ